MSGYSGPLSMPYLLTQLKLSVDSGASPVLGARSFGVSSLLSESALLMDR